MKNLYLMILAVILVPSLSLIVFLIQLVRRPMLGLDLSSYFRTIAIGLDQLGGSIIYNQEDYTISSYTYYLCAYKQNKYACMFMKFIDIFFGENHCERSFHNEQNDFRNHLQRAENA